MNLRELLSAAVLGVIEGLTEFLPVSSTGHLIAAQDLMGIRGDKMDTFAIFIQIGAIAAVAWDRRESVLGPAPIAAKLRLWTLVVLAFLPAAVIGFLAHGTIKRLLFSSTVVAWSLIIGAVVILLFESLDRRPTVTAIDQLTPKQAFIVGLSQCVSMVPGVSRAAATILGGLGAGLSRPVATELSFLLAIPTIGGAVALDLMKSLHLLSGADVPAFAVGLVVSFAVALAVVRWLLSYVKSHDFRIFAAWRIVVGLLILAFGLGKGNL